MTDDSTLQRLLGDDTRREFMKKGAAATAAAGVGATGLAGAHEGGQGAGESGDSDSVLDEGWKALTFVNNFHPRATFAIVSGVVDWVPNYGPVTEGWFSEYNTRVIRWQNTGETVPLFVAQDADVGQFDQEFGFVTDVDDDPNQPQLYEVEREWTPFSEDPRLVTMNASPVAEEAEDRILQDEEWWQDN